MFENNFGRIVPAGENYRDLSVKTGDAFTWEDGLRDTGTEGMYGVEFSSAQNDVVALHQPHLVSRLGELDEFALKDASEQPGFLHYYGDTVSGDGRARSFCLWASRLAAIAASQRKAHQAAVSYTLGEGKDVYSYYGIKKFTVERRSSGLVFATLARMAVSHGDVVVNWHCSAGVSPGS